MVALRPQMAQYAEESSTRLLALNPELTRYALATSLYTKLI